jgi:hypothetical protein
MRPPPRKPNRSETGRKRIIVAGSRTFNDYRLMNYWLDLYTIHERDPIIITGGAKGADTLAMDWAGFYWYLVKIYRPDYKKYPGSYAPLKRNEEMARNADMLIAFWDGKSKGTKHMIQQARLRGLKVKIVLF